MNLYRASRANFPSLLRKKGGFLAQVYGILAFEIAIMAITEMLLRNHLVINKKLQKFWFLWFILSLMLVVGISMTSRISPPVSLLLFTAFAITMGILSIPTSQLVSANSLKVAMIATALVFVTLSIVGGLLISAGIDLSFLTFTLFAALIGLIVVFTVMMFVPVSKTTHKVVLGFAIVLFSIYIAFDTNLMLQKRYTDPIDAAVNLFLDIINIFTDILAFDST